MFWQCILGPQHIFNALTLFLFTLKADYNKKWTFLQLFLNILVQNWRILMLSKQNKAEILIFSPQICPRVASNKNHNIFYRFSWNPINFQIFELFILKIMYRIELILCIKKHMVNLLIITPEMCELAKAPTTASSSVATLGRIFRPVW